MLHFPLEGWWHAVDRAVQLLLSSGWCDVTGSVLWPLCVSLFSVDCPFSTYAAAMDAHPVCVCDWGVDGVRACVRVCVCVRACVHACVCMCEVPQ